MLKKVLFYVVPAVVLGAIGSGLWDLALKPLGALLYSSGLQVLTLGRDSLRDELYGLAALRNSAYPAQVMLFYIAMIMAGLGVAVLSFPLVRIGMKMLDSSKANDVAVPAHGSSRKPGERRLKIKAVLFGLAVVYCTTFFCFLSLKAWYVTGVASTFDRLYTAAAPYMTPDERLLIQSQFAQVRNREDYVKVIDQVQKTIDDANLKPFNIWIF